MQNVPMIVTPFFGDQILVSETAQSLGIGKRVGGTTSIDTHANKDFLNEDLVEKLDLAVKQVLKGYEYTYNYLHLKLNYSPIVSLITSEIPYEDGDLILGEKNLIPRSREQLPTDLEAYVEHLSSNESQSISSEMDTVLNALRIYCGKNNLKQKILEYFSNTHNVHCLLSTTELDTDYISIAEDLLKNSYGTIYKYKNTNNVWIKDSKEASSLNAKKLTSLPKKLYLTSEDQTKLGALKEALTKMNLTSEIIGINPKIGVDEELVGADNIAEAALRRLSELKKQINDPCTIVSIVSGIIKKDSKWIDTSIAVAQDEQGNTSISRSAGLVFPDALVKKAQRRGFGKHTVSSVLAEESAEHNLGVDPHIILTSGLLSRRHLLEETFIETLNKLTL
jgi:non-canonical (house-cleaning) NTP pyrophosphatase